MKTTPWAKVKADRAKRRTKTWPAIPFKLDYEATGHRPGKYTVELAVWLEVDAKDVDLFADTFELPKTMTVSSDSRSGRLTVTIRGKR